MDFLNAFNKDFYQEATSSANNPREIAKMSMLIYISGPI